MRGLGSLQYLLARLCSCCRAPVRHPGARVFSLLQTVSSPVALADVAPCEPPLVQSVMYSRCCCAPVLHPGSRVVPVHAVEPLVSSFVCGSSPALAESPTRCALWFS